MHLIVVDTQRFVKMPYCCRCCCIIYNIYIFFIFVMVTPFPFSFLVSMYLCGIVKFNLFN